jgi:tRNA dimethylallyltransferase
MSLSGGSDVRDVAIICGPTAAGKSAIAMALAARTGALLISADSRQIYRRFDIGTAKPALSDLAAVPHWGIDIAEPTERYSAARWVAAAIEAMRDAASREQPVIIVGGTGFYLRALEEPLFESPPMDPVQRAALLAALETESTETLRERCRAVDPLRAGLGRTQLLRALETYDLTGRPLSAWLIERARPVEVRAHYLLVDPGAALRERVASRVHAMLDRGWELEVSQLARDIPADAPAWNGCGYAVLRSALAGDTSRAAAIERVIIDTRQYAKRQRTWFRHQLPAARVTAINPDVPDALRRAQAWLDAVSLTEHM